MILLVIKGGGTAIIGDKQISTWQHLYPFVDVVKEIAKLDKNKRLETRTFYGALKLINEQLRIKNKELEYIYK